MMIINAYAPTEDKNDFTKDQFHNKLGKIYDTTWENDTHGCLQIIWHLMKQIIFLQTEGDKKYYEHKVI